MILKLCISALAILPCAVSGATEFSPTPNTQVGEFLNEFVAKREKLNDYVAKFTQKKVSRLFNETETSTGAVYYKRPGRILWDYRLPDVMKVLVKERVVSIYTEELEQLEIYDFTEEKKMRGLFLGFDESPKELQELYDIALVAPGEGEQARIVKLVPKTEELISYFASVQLWLRPKDFAVYKILIVDPEDEGETSITLTDIRVNKGIRDAVLDIKVPEGTEIIRRRPDEQQPLKEKGIEEKTLPDD
jgi:outer membrane lipoprotein-sorting protein